MIGNVTFGDETMITMNGGYQIHFGQSCCEYWTCRKSQIWLRQRTQFACWLLFLCLYVYMWSLKREKNWRFSATIFCSFDSSCGRLTVNCTPWNIQIIYWWTWIFGRFMECSPNKFRYCCYQCAFYILACFEHRQHKPQIKKNRTRTHRFWQSLNDKLRCQFLHAVHRCGSIINNKLYIGHPFHEPISFWHVCLSGFLNERQCFFFFLHLRRMHIKNRIENQTRKKRSRSFSWKFICIRLRHSFDHCFFVCFGLFFGTVQILIEIPSRFSRRWTSNGKRPHGLWHQFQIGRFLSKSTS